MLFRYPGSKNKIAKPIIAWLKRHLTAETEYREPFFGGGAIGLALLEAKTPMGSMWINDNDATLCCVWRSVYHYPHDLIAWLRWYKNYHLDRWQLDRVPKIHKEPRFRGRPGVDSPELIQYLALEPKARTSLPEPPDYSSFVEGYLSHFYDQQRLMNQIQEMPSSWDQMVDVAWKKITLHQTSYSGLGTAAGPIGGKEQKSDWIMGCRYMPETTAKKLMKIHKWFHHIKMHEDVCTHGDFGRLITADGDAVMYFDPPYYEQGPKLYRDSFTVKDHERLAGMLACETRPWLLSYDNHEAIRDLYSKPGIYMREFDLRYTIVRMKKTDDDTSREVKKTELVISNCPFLDGEFGD